jgi:hypothetical protein
MNRTIVWVLIVLVLCVVGLGFYRGWFVVTTSNPETGSHKVNVNLAVDPDKMKADANSVTGETTGATGKPQEGDH